MVAEAREREAARRVDRDVVGHELLEAPLAEELGQGRVVGAEGVAHPERVHPRVDLEPLRRLEAAALADDARGVLRGDEPARLRRPEGDPGAVRVDEDRLHPGLELGERKRERAHAATASFVSFASFALLPHSAASVRSALDVASLAISASAWTTSSAGMSSSHSTSVVTGPVRRTSLS